MKKLLLVVIFLVVSVIPATAKDITLKFAWDANTELDMASYAIFIRQEGQVYNYTQPIDPTCTIAADGKCYIDPVAKTCEFNHTFTAPDGVISTFYFVVRAKDSETPPQWSADSNELSETYDLRVMPDPTMLAGSYNDTTKTINFTWEQPDASRVTRWDLFNSSVGGGPYTKVGELENTGQVPPYFISWTVPEDGNYYFTVVAFTEEVFSQNSNEAYVQVKVHPSPVHNFKVKIRIR